MGKVYRDLVRQHSTAKGSTRAVLNVLADYANDHGFAWPGRAAIASEAGLSERTVVRAIQSLCAAGWLEIVENAVGGRGKKPGYRITVPALLKGDKNTPERVTDCPLKGDNVTVKGDILTQKGDSVTQNQSYARSEPQEPYTEPNLEPAQEAPQRVPVIAKTNYGTSAIDFGRGFPGRHRQHIAVDGIAKQYQAFGLTAQDFNGVVNAILDGMNKTRVANLGTAQGDRVHAEAQECALSLVAQGRNTPAEVAQLFATYRQYDFRGKKGQLPTFKSIVDHAAELPGLIEASKGTQNGNHSGNSGADYQRPAAATFTTAERVAYDAKRRAELPF